MSMAAFNRELLSLIRTKAIEEQTRDDRVVSVDEMTRLTEQRTHAAAEIARLTRELEEARERERALRDDLTEAIGHLAALVDLYRDGYPESDHAARLVSAAETYLESPSREQDVPSALSTPQEAGDGTTRWYCEYGCGCVLDSRSARYHDCRTPSGEGEAVRVPGAVERPCDCAGCHCANVGDAEEVGYADGWNACRDAMLAALRSEAPGEDGITGDELLRSLCRSLIGRIMEVSDPDAVDTPGDVSLRLESIIRERDRLRTAPVPAREGEEPDLLEAAMQGVLVAEALEELYERLKMSAKDRKAFSAEMAQIMAELEPTRTAIDAARLRGEGGGG